MNKKIIFYIKKIALSALKKTIFVIKIIQYIFYLLVIFLINDILIKISYFYEKFIY